MTQKWPDVFIADDKFVDVVRCLEARGWLRHAHATFPKFRLKWTNYSKIAWPHAARHINRGQWLNHLQHAVLYSQKDVFARALYALEATSSGTVAVDAFFPRTFDLRCAVDVQLLREWHIYSRALAVLKHFAASRATTQHNNSDCAEVAAACTLLQTVVDAGALFFSRTARLSAALPVLDVDASAWQLLHHDASRPASMSAIAQRSATPINKTVVTQLLTQLESLDVQFDAVSGALCDSVWICKPSNLSQGRGICLHTSLDAMLALANATDANEVAGNKWIVQKYIEQPHLLLEHGHKFDIRQWVLITSLKPLRVYWYRQCYLRLCAMAFSIADATQRADRFAHLSNHSVQQHHAAPRATSTADLASPSPSPQSSVERDTCTSMWHSDAFQRYLAQQHGRDVWHETIVPQMQHATRNAIRSTASQLQCVGNGFEWLGLDFVLDVNLRPWLLEVNVSPDVSHSTSVTTDLVPRATADLFELLLDDTVSADNNWHLLNCNDDN